MENKKITIIIPLHKFNADYELMVNNALSSVEPFKDKVKTMIVGTEEVLKNFSNDELILVENTGNTNYQSQINLGVEKVDTEWFSILEVDDDYNEIWYKSMTEYMEHYTDTDVFLPIVKNINVEGKSIGYINESSWAYGFTDKIGYIDYETLLEYQNYQLSGGLFKKESVEKCGGLFKDNIKLTFMYEAILRLTFNKLNVMTVPRVGYNHVNFREDSLFWNIKFGEDLIDVEESKFWLTTAKEESNYNDKREVIYNG